MKRIVVFGAGKSATVLIDYLLQESVNENWEITVADADQNLAEKKTGAHPNARAIGINMEEDITRREQLITGADIVISLLPPQLHMLAAKDCIKYKKNLLTASYLDAAINELQKEIEENGLLFLYEMGLDPGIDHMSAMQLIDSIKEKNGSISVFKSHCGGLVAPESDHNPWHYKISWNPRNIVMAGKAGAEYLWNGKLVTIDYQNLFADPKLIFVDSLENLSYYPNRDSMHYIPLYHLEGVQSFLRTTIRHTDFMYGWNNLIELHFTDEEKIYETTDKSLAMLFKEHLGKQHFPEWVSNKMLQNLKQTKSILDKLTALQEAEEDTLAEGKVPDDHFMVVGDDGSLEEVDLDAVKSTGASVLAHQMHQNNLTLKLLFYLGMDDEQTMVNKGLCSAADILQFALEQKLKLSPADKDMIVMQHEIEYFINKKLHKTTSTLVVKGMDATRTAMAKTVGLPLGIAAKLILNGHIITKGLTIPIHKEIYEPVLAELQKWDICFRDKDEIFD
jgi:saccharopine dehydrogenase-like NADP-dependent oxidoreductase